MSTTKIGFSQFVADIVVGHKPFTKWEVILDTWVLALVLIGSLTGIYSEYRWRKLFASIIENSEKDAAELGRQQRIIAIHEDTIRDHKAQITDRDETIEVLRDERQETAKRILSLEDSITQYQSEVAERIESYRVTCRKLESRDMDVAAQRAAIKESDAAYETLRMEYDQLHAAHKLLKHGVDMTIGELNAMTLERDRLLEVIKLRDKTIDNFVARTNELNSQIDGLKYSIKTRGGQSPDLNTAWHMKETPVAVKQKYLLDDTPLDDSGSGVIDFQPYGE